MIQRGRSIVEVHTRGPQKTSFQKGRSRGGRPLGEVHRERSRGEGAQVEVKSIWDCFLWVSYFIFFRFPVFQIS